MNNSKYYAALSIMVYYNAIRETKWWEFKKRRKLRKKLLKYDKILNEEVANKNRSR